jgi:hypothetical protein
MQYEKELGRKRLIKAWLPAKSARGRSQRLGLLLDASDVANLLGWGQQPLASSICSRPASPGFLRCAAGYSSRRQGILRSRLGRMARSLLGQRNLLPPDAVGLQSDELVQAPMSVAAVSKRHFPDPASADSVDARTTRPHRKALAAQSPRQRLPRSCLVLRTAQHRAHHGLKWLSFTTDSGQILMLRDSTHLLAELFRW